MNLYIGTKVVKAVSMTRKEYNDYRGWELPPTPGEDGFDKGYLVEYTDGGKSNHTSHSGYISWSPKDVFERAYSIAQYGMSFGDAIKALKLGQKVARKGWNGKGMWLVLVPGTQAATLRDDSPYAKATGLQVCEILPHIDMWTTNAEGRRAMLTGWLASQTDMLSDDWSIVV